MRDDAPTTADDERTPAAEDRDAEEQRAGPADVQENAEGDGQDAAAVAADGADAGPAEPDEADAPTAPSDEADAGAPDAAAADAPTGDDGEAGGPTEPQPGVPEDVRKYDRFQKMDGAQYDRANEFLRDRTYITAREWAIARLCADFRTETGVEMTKIGENLPDLVPFMTDTYTPQAVNQARASFEEKVRKAGATFLYGAMCDFFTAEELDELMYETTEVAKFLLEVEGVDLSVEEELEAEDRISGVMREVRASSERLRHEGTECPNCGHEIAGDD